MLALIREGSVQPTAAAVAERAGVSLRLVFHHFDDMETLMRHALSLQAARVAPLIVVPVAPDAPLDTRLTRFVEGRAALFEEITPVRRAARQLEARSGSIAEGLRQMRALLRQQVLYLFGAELRRAGPAVTAAAQALTSWMTWESLRRHQGLDAPSAQETLAAGLQALLTSSERRA